MEPQPQIMPGMLIATAPNGARKTKADHPALPISPADLAETAKACNLAGAGMIHLHVRDDDQRHSLDAGRYREAVAAVKEQVGDNMIIQVTTEAAGVFQTDQQIEAVRALEPTFVSFGLRELFPNPASLPEGLKLLLQLQEQGAVPQFIFYDPSDLLYYEHLCRSGVIPGKQHMMLFVLGRYGASFGKPEDLVPFLAALNRPAFWMACCFGPGEGATMQAVAALGGHCRVGFENNQTLLDGSTAPDNAALVMEAADAARRIHRPILGGKEAQEVIRRIALEG